MEPPSRPGPRMASLRSTEKFVTANNSFGNFARLGYSARVLPRRNMRSLIAGACLLLLGASCARPRPRPQPVPPVTPTVQRPAEIRAVWVSDTLRLDWDEATRQLQRAGFNTMYVNLASGGAMFGSDAVARGITLAHQRGLAVH